MVQLILGFRSLLYRKKQYISLFLICLFGTGISLFSLFMSRGMLDSLNQKAEVYYGGDFCVMSNHWMQRYIPDYQKTAAKIKEILPDDAVVTARYDFDAGEVTSFYYEGEEVRQRVIKGVNFKEEKALFNKLNYLSGDADIESGSNQILISEPIAKKLHVVTGDEIILYLRTLNGYINTVPLEIKGIFQDSSVFGMFTTYMDFEFLRKTYGWGEDFANRICVEFPQRKGISQKDLEEIQTSFEKVFNMFPLVDNKMDFYTGAGDRPAETLAIIALKANLNDVKILKNAMTAIITLVIVLLVIIIVAGIGSTYRVIVMKRINEIGVYMAIGMKKRAIMQSLLFESLFLLLSGCGAGLIFAGLLCRIIACFKFTFIPSFSIFLTRGYLNPLFDGRGVIALLASVIIVTLFAVFYSVRKCVSIMPCQAIAANE